MRATWDDGGAGCVTSSGEVGNAHGEAANGMGSVHEAESAGAGKVGSGSENASYAHWEACARATSGGAAGASGEAAIGTLNVDEVASTVKYVSELPQGT